MTESTIRRSQRRRRGRWERGSGGPAWGRPTQDVPPLLRCRCPSPACPPSVDVPGGHTMPVNWFLASMEARESSLRACARPRQRRSPRHPFSVSCCLCVVIVCVLSAAVVGPGSLFFRRGCVVWPYVGWFGASSETMELRHVKSWVDVLI